MPSLVNLTGFPALDKGATFLVASTVPAHYVQHLEEAFKARGRDDILLVDCPVSGGAQRAADGTLSIMAGGSKEALNSAMPILKALSADDKLFLPGGIGAGSNLKVVHQVLAGIQILGTSEAMGYASSLGLDLGKARDAVVDSRAYSWMFENRSPRILTGIFVPPPSALTIILKDVVSLPFRLQLGLIHRSGYYHGSGSLEQVPCPTLRCI